MNVNAKRKTLMYPLLLLLIGLLLLSAGPASRAHEIAPGQVYRWGNVKTNPTTYIRYAYVECSNYCMNNPTLASCYTTALAHWNSNSNNKAQFVNVAYGASKLDFVTPTSQYWEWGSQVAGMTLVKNSSGKWAFANRLGPGGFNSGTIVYAQIQFNPSTTLYNTVLRRDFLLRHEMGHVLGLGHPPDNTASVMHAWITDTQWSTLQAHDRTDLTGFYG